MFGKNNNNTYLFPSPSLFSGQHDHHYKDNIVQALVENHHQYLQAEDDPCSAVEKKKKERRHSKIFTSQGPRDRRVRLSIGIARKFFDLQEMLGFDKPSKTLEWLLTKSNSSIKDLVQTTKQKSRNNLDDDDDDDDDDNKKYTSSPILGGNDKGRSGNIKNKGSSSSLKESRAKARARARERTREKMCIKQQQQQQLTNISNNYNVNSVGTNFQQQQQLIEESVLIKRNLFVSGYDHDDQNWDVCSFASQANLCAILDQHKFMNSSSNM